MFTYWSYNGIVSSRWTLEVVRTVCCSELRGTDRRIRFLRYIWFLDGGKKEQNRWRSIMDEIFKHSNLTGLHSLGHMRIWISSVFTDVLVKTNPTTAANAKTDMTTTVLCCRELCDCDGTEMERNSNSLQLVRYNLSYWDNLPVGLSLMELSLYRTPRYP